MIRETYRAESIALERVIAHFINKVPGQSLVNACRSAIPFVRLSVPGTTTSMGIILRSQLEFGHGSHATY